MSLKDIYIWQHRHSHIRVRLYNHAVVKRGVIPGDRDARGKGFGAGIYSWRLFQLWLSFTTTNTTTLRTILSVIILYQNLTKWLLSQSCIRLATTLTSNIT
jgi:hypothetical protein